MAVTYPIEARFSRDEFELKQSPTMRVKLYIEAENIGRNKTSLEPTLIFSAYDADRNLVSYEFKILNESRSIDPFEPKMLVADTICSVSYIHMWYRSIKACPTQGLSSRVLLLNASNKEINWFQYEFGRLIFKIFGWVPGGI